MTNLNQRLATFLRRVNLHIRLLIAFIAVSLLPISGVSVMSYYAGRRAIDGMSHSYAQQQVDLLMRNIDSVLLQYVTVLNQVATNTDLVNHLKRYASVSGSAQHEAFQYVYKYINDITRGVPHFITLEVANREQIIANTQYRIAADPVQQSTLVREAIASLDRFVWFGARPFEYRSGLSDSYDTNDSHAVIVSRRITDFTSGTTIGVANLAFHESALHTVFGDFDFAGQGHVYVATLGGRIVSHSDKSFRGLQESSILTEAARRLLSTNGPDITDHRAVVMDGQRFLVSVAGSSVTDWRMMAVVSYSLLYEEIGRIGTWISIIVGALAVFIVPLSIVVTRSVTQPVDSIVRAMEAVQGSDLTVSVGNGTTDEIGFLEQSFNEMVSRLRRLITEVYEVRLTQREAEFRALEAQINPHFLYNTLDLINWMAYLNGQPEISTLVDSLSRFFRLSLNKGNEIYTIEREIEHVQAYVAVQQIRYKDKIRFVVDAEPECLQFRTIKILLQPLVENSIHHGLEPKESGGTIKVSVRLRDSRLLMDVRDDGVGLTAASAPTTRRDFTSNGYGIRNVDERIKMYFGREFGLELREVPSGGTVATIVIPAMRMEAE